MGLDGLVQRWFYLLPYQSSKNEQVIETRARMCDTGSAATRARAA
jgi:hypothetical protein